MLNRQWKRFHAFKSVKMTQLIMNEINGGTFCDVVYYCYFCNSETARRFTRQLTNKFYT